MTATYANKATRLIAIRVLLSQIYYAYHLEFSLLLSMISTVTK